MESYGNKIKTGLILEGGALRGLFSAGVMDVMLENGIQFDGMIGVSAGAAFGCNFKSKQAGRVIRYNKRFAHDWRFFFASLAYGHRQPFRRGILLSHNAR